MISPIQMGGSIPTMTSFTQWSFSARVPSLLSFTSEGKKKKVVNTSLFLIQILFCARLIWSGAIKPTKRDWKAWV